MKAITVFFFERKMTMNRKGENAFNLDEEKTKYEIGMEVYLKDKAGEIIFMNDHYITIKYDDGIKESFIWHELFAKYEHLLLTPEEQAEAEAEEERIAAAEKAEKEREKKLREEEKAAEKKAAEKELNKE